MNKTGQLDSKQVNTGRYIAIWDKEKCDEVNKKKWEYEEECIAPGQYKLVQSKKASLKKRCFGWPRLLEGGGPIL